MNTVVYFICGMPILGLFMAGSDLCYFPDIINSGPVSLENKGVLLRGEFTAPVSTKYNLTIHFINKFPEYSEINDGISGQFGRYTKYCHNKNVGNYESMPENERSGLGIPTTLRIIIKKTPENSVLYDSISESICLTYTYKNNINGKKAIISVRDAWSEKLDRGEYLIEVSNVVSIPNFPKGGAEIHLDGRLDQMK